MTDMQAADDWKIGEDELYKAAPSVRALIVKRYESLYAEVEDYREQVKSAGRPADPRYLEIGVRILKELGQMYRLGRPPAAAEDDDDPNAGVDPGKLVLARLEELEAKAAGLG